MKLSTNASNTTYDFSSSVKMVHNSRSNTTDNYGTGTRENSLRTHYYSQRIIQTKNKSDHLHYREMERFGMSENDQYVFRYKPARQLHYGHDTSGDDRINQDREFSHDGSRGFHRRGNDPSYYYENRFETSYARRRDENRMYDERYYPRSRPEGRIQVRIAGNCTTTSSLTSSSSPSSLRSSSEHSSVDDKGHGMYNNTYNQFHKATEISRNFATQDQVQDDYDSNDEDEYWNRQKAAFYNIEKTRTPKQGDDNDASYCDQKMPAKSTSLTLSSTKPSASLSDSTDPANEEQSSGKMIEISPGCKLPLRGADETWNAVLNDFYMPHECVCCETTVFCIQDAHYVVCPTCRVINPLPGVELNEGKGGVGLGFLIEDLANWQNKIAGERKVVSSKPNNNFYGYRS